MFIQIQTRAMISSSTTSTTTAKKGNVTASSALSVERQSKAERKRKGKSIREGNGERKLRSMVSQSFELPALQIKLFVFILIVYITVHLYLLNLYPLINMLYKINFPIKRCYKVCIYIPVVFFLL